MAGAAVDLKIVVGIVQESQAAIKSVITDLTSIIAAIQILDKSSLENVASQIRSIAAASKASITEMKPLTQTSVTPEIGSTGIQEVVKEEVESAKADLESLGEAAGDLDKKIKKTGKDSGLKEFKKDAEETTISTEHLRGYLDRLLEGVKFLAGGFLALKAVQIAKEWADVAARTQVLGTVLHVVGGNAGYSKKELDEMDKSVQKLGITASASRQALTNFIQSGLPLQKAGELARAAQDLAVIAGQNSSQVFQRMIVNIQQLDTMGLRWMGIVVNNAEAQQVFATSIGKTTGSLTQQEKQLALLNGVLEKSKGLAGSYEAAMGDVGKQLTSMERYSEDLKDALGKGLLPAYLALVIEFRDLLTYFKLVTEAEGLQSESAEKLGDVVRGIASALRHTVIALVEYKDVFIVVIGAYGLFILANSAAVASVYSFVTSIGAAILASTTFSELLIALDVKLGVTAGAFGLLSKGGIGVTAIILLVGAAITYLIVTGNRFADLFVSGPVGVAFTAFEAGAGIAVTAVDGVISVIRTLMDVFTLNFSHIGKIWDGFIDRAKKAAVEVKNTAVATAQLFEHGVTGKKPGEDKEEKSNLDAARNRLVIIMDAVAEQESLFNKLNRGIELKPGKFQQEQIDEAKKKLDELKVGLKKYDAEYHKSLDENAKGDASVIEREKKKLEIAKARVAEEKRRKEVSEAELKLITPKYEIREGQKMSRGYVDEEGRLQTLLEKDYGVKPTKDNLTKLVAGYKLLSDSVLLPKDLAEFTEKVAEFKKVVTDPGARREVDNYFAMAQKKAGDAARSEFAPLTADAKAHWKYLADMRSEDISHQLALTKQSNAAQESLDRIRYGAGELSLDEYYKNREERIIESGNLEIALQKAQIAEMESEYKRFKGTMSVTEREAAQKQIQTEKNKLDLLAGAGPSEAHPEGVKGKTEQEVEALNIEKLEQKRVIQLQIKRLKDESAAIDGGEPARIEQIRQKYRDLAIQLKKEISPEDLKSLEQADITKLKRENALRVQAIRDEIIQSEGTQEERIELINRQYEEQLRLLAGIEGAVDAINKAKSSKVDALKRDDADQIKQIQMQSARFFGGEAEQLEEIDYKYDQMYWSLRKIPGAWEAIANARGIEKYQASLDAINRRMAARNALDQAWLDIDRASLEEKIDKGEVTNAEAMNAQNDLILREMELVKQQVADKEYLISLEEEQLRQAEERGEGVEGLELRIQELNRDLVDLNKNWIVLGNQLDSYGKQLRKGFTDSLSGAMKDVILHAKTARQALTELGRNFRDQIVDIWTKDLAKKAVKGLIDITGGEGNSIFDIVGKALGVETKRGDAKTKPLYVEEVNKALGGKAVGDLMPELKDVPGKIESATKGGVGNFLKMVKDGFTDVFSTLNGILAKMGGGVVSTIGKIVGALGSVGGLFKSGTPNVTSKISYVVPPAVPPPMPYAEGGIVSGPGTSRSDDIPAMLSNGEHVMPADKVKRWLPVLEAIRKGKLEGKFSTLEQIATGVKHAMTLALGGLVNDPWRGMAMLPAFAGGGLVEALDTDIRNLQSIAIPTIGSASMPDDRTKDSAANVKSSHLTGNLVVQLHPDAMNMTLRDWLDHEVARQYGRR